MSEQQTEQEALDLGNDPAAGMAAILDFLAPSKGDTGAEPGAAEGGDAGAGAGQQPPAGEGAGGEPGSTPAQGAGDGGGDQVPTDGQPATEGAGAVDDGPRSTAGTVDATELSEKWGEIATAFEKSQTDGLRQEALSAIREEYPKYFDALQKHPRMLVGQRVPALQGNGEETLRDAQDARDWQEAVKHLLSGEVDSRVEARQGELQGAFTTVHSSIEMFRNNPDLVPGTKQFDRELADRFATFASDYAERVDGKIIGYSVPVQPMINKLRSDLAAARAAKAAPPAAPPAPSQPSQQQQRAAEQPRTEQGQWAPQAGLTSKAGHSADGAPDEASGLLSAFARQNGFSF